MSTSVNTLNTIPESVKRIHQQYSKPTKEYASIELEYGGEIILEYEDAVQFMKLLHKAFKLNRGYGHNPVSIKDDLKIDFKKMPSELISLIRFGSNMNLSMEQIEDIYEQSKNTTAKTLFPEDTFNTLFTSQT